ncbi:MAG: hypothetical protein Q4F17_06035 [Eubacteriales bacterium]|nr:hypothetical protein [Eubacteriales bacterium]
MKKGKWLIALLGILLVAAAAAYWTWSHSYSRFSVKQTYQVTVTDSQVVFLPTTIEINSTDIRISAPKGQPAVRVCLYYAGETESILEHQLKAGEQVAFKGLKSVCEYAVGVIAETEFDGPVTLNVEYWPLNSH